MVAPGAPSTRVEYRCRHCVSTMARRNRPKGCMRSRRSASPIAANTSNESVPMIRDEETLAHLYEGTTQHQSQQLVMAHAPMRKKRYG